MSETNYADFADGKSSKDRTVMHILYGMHTISPFTAWVLAVIALVVNYVRKADETDPLYMSHHLYMIRTFWWTVLWLAVSCLVAVVMTITIILIIFVWLPFAIVGAWYLYRCIRGWLRFNDNQMAP
jgi:uncharacterized membrane protein